MSKKICFIQDGLGGGGAEHVIVTLANEFVNDGYEVEIGLYDSLTISYPLDERVKVTAIDRNNYNYVSRREKVIYQTKVFLIKKVVYQVGRCIGTLLKPINNNFLTKIEGKLREYNRKCNRVEPIRRFVEERTDVVLISFMVHCYNTLLDAIGQKKKNVVIISERDDPGAVKKAGVIKLRSQSMRLADACVFQTEEALKFMKDEIGEKGVVIPNPLSGQITVPFVGERQKIIVNFCRLHEKKNLPLLINAFERLAKEFDEYKLYIYGKGELKESLQKLIESKKLENKIFIYDFVPNIHEVVNTYSMFVSSSDFEGISNSMIEAMAMGLPVVCTDCPIGGAAMMIDSYENGILTSVGDEEELYAAMKYMIVNPEEARRMGQAARNIKVRLNPKQIAKEWEHLIENLSKRNA